MYCVTHFCGEGKDGITAQCTVQQGTGWEIETPGHLGGFVYGFGSLLLYGQSYPRVITHHVLQCEGIYTGPSSDPDIRIYTRVPVRGLGADLPNVFLSLLQGPFIFFSRIVFNKEVRTAIRYCCSRKRPDHMMGSKHLTSVRLRPLYAGHQRAFRVAETIPEIFQNRVIQCDSFTVTASRGQCRDAGVSSSDTALGDCIKPFFVPPRTL